MESIGIEGNGIGSSSSGSHRTQGNGFKVSHSTLTTEQYAITCLC